MIELQNVSKAYQHHVVLHPLSLTFAAGKTTVLLGPSGCGKSTLLRMIVGLVACDQGQILLDGVAINPRNLPQVRRKLGYVIQDGGLFPHLTASENVALMARFNRWTPQQMANRVQELAALTRFPQTLLERYPHQLSGGQRQRVGVMRALMLDPQVILLDEPLGALDPLVRYDLQADLREIFQSLNKTVVLVTHDLGEAAFLADDILLLGDGHVAQRGSFADLAFQPANEYVARFLRAQRIPNLEVPV